MDCASFDSTINNHLRKKKISIINCPLSIPVSPPGGYEISSKSVQTVIDFPAKNDRIDDEVLCTAMPWDGRGKC